MAESLGAEPADPVLEPISGADLRRLLDEPLPSKGCPPEAVLRLCRDILIRYNRRNGHPDFFAYVCASADPIGVLADALASAMNQNVTAWRSAPPAAELERRVIAWLDEMVGFAGPGHGLLVGGGSAANFNALAAAILNVADSTVSRERMTVYLSRDAHVSLSKAARLLGIQSQHIRKISLDARRRLDPAGLARQLEADRTAGLVPACICASAGTANTGAIDPLAEIADLVSGHRIWFHIDGAYGAPAAMTDDYAWMKIGFARADSLSLDPHKWLFAPLDAGCILYRDPAASARAFSVQAEYTAVSQTDPIEGFAFFDHGLELSRRFRALKVWMILK
ncbi:MAG: pyridoxal phosphate-dependent decarboxylase family protein, partial [Phycisphaerae bacterium]